MTDTERREAIEDQRRENIARGICPYCILPHPFDETGARVQMVVEDGRMICPQCEVDMRIPPDIFTRLAVTEAALDEARVAQAAAESRLAAVTEALLPFARFGESYRAQPLRSVADEFYGIHGCEGSDHGGASLRFTDCVRAADALAATSTEAAAATTALQALEEIGKRAFRVALGRMHDEKWSCLIDLDRDGFYRKWADTPQEAITTALASIELDGAAVTAGGEGDDDGK